MSLFKSKTAKFFVGFVALAMIVTFVATPSDAKAATAAELQAQINALMSQINSLQGVTGTETGTGIPSGFQFTSDMTMGSTGTSAMYLQKFLNANSFTVATTGAGSPGMETSTFGPATKAALMKYQSAQGIAPAVGYFGPITRTNVNAKLAVAGPVSTGNFPAGCTSSAGYSTTTGMSCASSTTLPAGCTSTTGFSSTTGLSCSGGSTPVVGGALQGGVGDITVTERNSGTDNSVIEGSTEAKVIGFEVEADGSDVNVSSVRVEFKRSGSGGSTRLERYVDSVSIMLDNKVVGTADASDFSKSGTTYSENIAVTGAIVRQDDKSRFYVAVNANDNIDSSDLDKNWIVGLGSIRFEDATGAILTDTTGTGATGSIIETFSFEDLSSSGDLRLRALNDDSSVNDAHTVTVDDTSDTNGVKVLSFKLDAEGSDIFLNAINKITIVSSGAGVTEIANDFRLEMDGEEVGTVSIDKDCDGGDDGFASTTDTSICVVVSDLDNDDVIIGEGDSASFVLFADINDIDGAFTSGDKFSSVTLDADDIDAEDSNGDAVGASDLTGTGSATDLKFQSSGISVTVVSTNNPSQNLNVESSATDNTGLFEVTFDVTAVEDDAYVELGSATRDTTESDTGVNFVIQDQPNSYAATTTGSISLADVTRVSGGTTSGDFVRINAGQTARFKVAVTFDPGHVTGSSVGYRMYLYSVNFAATAVNATSQQVLTPEADYRTGATTIGN